jgi:hypothetical protein
LEHPLLQGLDIDDPRTTFLRRQIIQGKPFLRKIYEEWYLKIAEAIPIRRWADLGNRLWGWVFEQI